MVPEQEKVDFLFRRSQEACPGWVIALPVAFAFAVVLLIVLFKHKRVPTFLWSSMIVGILSAVYLATPLVLKGLLPGWGLSWWYILIPFLAVGLVYVWLMYLRDAQSIHPIWASFLGLLRCTVYAILAFVFLLPGCQYCETNETHAKLVILSDVSLSMSTIDDLPELGQDPAKLPTRQDKVLQFFTGLAKGDPKNKSFIERVLQKSPATVYRFGTVADESNVHNLKEGSTLTLAEWTDFLKPDKKKIEIPAKLPVDEQLKLRSKLNDLFDSLMGGTNVGGSALQVATLEAGSFLQAIVIVSDGQSNLGSDDAIKEFLARVGNRQAARSTSSPSASASIASRSSIRIDDLQAPEVARPDDKFPVRVPVVGPACTDEEFDVTLEMQRIKDKARASRRPASRSTSSAPRRASSRAAATIRTTSSSSRSTCRTSRRSRRTTTRTGVLEGTWQFIAKVPRHKNEAFPKEEHVSDPPTQVLVQKKKLRVLLVRRRADARVPVRPHPALPRGAGEAHGDGGLPADRPRGRRRPGRREANGCSTHFPNRLGPDDPPDKYSSLNEYDVILAFDPDWTLLEPKQLQLVKEWVGNHAGGIIFVAGPGAHLPSGPAGRSRPVELCLTIFPVVLKDSRLHGLGIGTIRRGPTTLNFTPAAKAYRFPEAGRGRRPARPPAGTEFFWGAARSRRRQGRHPVARLLQLLPGREAQAGVHRSSPPSPAAGIAHQRRQGRAALHRDHALRQRQDHVHRLGRDLAAAARSSEATTSASGSRWPATPAAGTSSRRSTAASSWAASTPPAPSPSRPRSRGPTCKPLPRDITPHVLVKRPEGFDPKLDPESPEAFDLRPKTTQGEWNGWFVGSFKVRTPGEYEFKIPIPGTVRIAVAPHHGEEAEPGAGQRPQQLPGAVSPRQADAGEVLKRLDPANPPRGRARPQAARRSGPEGNQPRRRPGQHPVVLQSQGRRPHHQVPGSGAAEERKHQGPAAWTSGTRACRATWASSPRTC